jgi:hypothetical protein
MEFNRNHYLLFGLILVFLGLQFNQVDSFVLTPEFTNFLARRSGHPIAAVQAASQSIFQVEKPLITVRKAVRPPEWLGWCMMSVGAVLVLHSLAMRKPGGG